MIKQIGFIIFVTFLFAAVVKTCAKYEYIQGCQDATGNSYIACEMNYANKWR